MWKKIVISPSNSHDPQHPFYKGGMGPLTFPNHWSSSITLSNFLILLLLRLLVLIPFSRLRLKKKSIIGLWLWSTDGKLAFKRHRCQFLFSGHDTPFGFIRILYTGDGWHQIRGTGSAWLLSWSTGDFPIQMPIQKSHHVRWFCVPTANH